jgi:hypothetical protein
MRVLIENKIPATLAFLILEEVDVVVVSFHFIVDRTFAIPPVHHLFHLVLAVAKLEGDRPFFYLIS